MFEMVSNAGIGRACLFEKAPIVSFAASRFEMDSSLEWLKRPCSWCVQDRKCYPFDKPTSISMHVFLK